MVAAGFVAAAFLLPANFRSSLQDMTSDELTRFARVRELLESQSTMTLATVDEPAHPHASPLFFFSER